MLLLRVVGEGGVGGGEQRLIRTCVGGISFVRMMICHLLLLLLPFSSFSSSLPQWAAVGAQWRGRLTVQ
jgi:hypothetical protein